MALVDEKVLGPLLAKENERLEKVRLQWERDSTEKSLERMAPVVVEVMNSTASNRRNKSKLSAVKKIIRLGIPPSLKVKAWSQMLMVDQIESYNRSFETGLRRTFGGNIPEPLPQVPLFGGALNRSLPLTAEGYRTVELILCIIGHDLSDIDYCPFLPSLVSLMLHFASPSDTLGITLSILKSARSSKHWTYLPVGRKETVLLAHVFVDMVKKSMPRLDAHIRSMAYASSSWPSFWEEVFSSLFVGHLPLPSIFRILDSLFFEGFKVFFRVGFGLLRLMEKYLYGCDSFAQLSQALKRELSVSEGARFEELLKNGFSMSLNRASLAKSKFNCTSHVSQILVQFSEINLPEKPELSEPSEIITDQELAVVWNFVPFRLRISNLELVYNSRLQGHSLNQLYLASSAPNLMVIKTMKGSRFGAYLSHSWGDRKPKSFFGNGECFLFSLDGDKTAVFPWVKVKMRRNSVKIEKDPEGHAKTPDYFMMGEHNHLVVGGGGGKFGLWIDGDLRFGRSETCTTFNNAPLTKEDQFEILSLELFTFV